MYSKLQSQAVEDDPAHPLDMLHILQCGQVEPLWFPQWTKCCASLASSVRLVGVVADGNCGPASVYSAHSELHFKQRCATPAE